jgi:hypothetical protein
MKLGADPEFFILNEHSNLINAAKICPANKNNPVKVANEVKIFHDNVLLEFNIQEATSCEEFVLRCMKAKDYVKNAAPANYRISLHAYGELEQEELKAKNAKDYGCVSDLNAYTLCENELPLNILKSANFRMAGGHIHIGGNDNDIVINPVYKPLYVFMLDLFLGIPSVLIDQSTDSYRRRAYFGMAGSYRDKPYGIEYRVLSSFWLRNESTIGLYYLLNEFVFHEMNDGIWNKFYKFNIKELKSNNPEQAYNCYGYDQSALIRAINTSNYSLARKFFNFAVNFMPNRLVSLVQNEINNPCSLIF